MPADATPAKTYKTVKSDRRWDARKTMLTVATTGVCRTVEAGGRVRPKCRVYMLVTVLLGFLVGKEVIVSPHLALAHRRYVSACLIFFCWEQVRRSDENERWLRPADAQTASDFLLQLAAAPSSRRRGLFQARGLLQCSNEHQLMFFFPVNMSGTSGCGRQWWTRKESRSPR